MLGIENGTDVVVIQSETVEVGRPAVRDLETPEYALV